MKNNLLFCLKGGPIECFMAIWEPLNVEAAVLSSRELENKGQSRSSASKTIKSF